MLFQHLGIFIGAAPSALSDDESLVSLVLVKAGERSTALITDSLEGSRKVVVKNLGAHINSIPGVTGVACLGDGRIVIILEVRTLVRSQRDDRPETRAMSVQPNGLYSLLIPLQKVCALLRSSHLQSWGIQERAEDCQSGTLVVWTGIRDACPSFLSKSCPEKLSRRGWDERE